MEGATPPIHGDPTPSDMDILVRAIADIIEATCVIRVVQSPTQPQDQEEAA